MISAHTLSKRAGVQEGWAMLETAISMGLLAAILSIITILVQKASKDIDESTTVSAVNKGDVALIGYLLTYQRLPEPESMKDSPGRPNYKEGWLPLSALQMSSVGGRVRYLVHESLIRKPAILNADPRNVTGGKVGVRDTLSVADPCANLLALETSGESLPGKPPHADRRIRAGYVLQQIKDTAGEVSTVETIWPGDGAEPEVPPANLNFTTTAMGFNELAGELGCFNYMPKLAASVKSAGVAIDLAALAQLNVDLQEHEIRMLKRKILDLKWRLGNWIAGDTSYIARAAILGAGMSLTPPGILDVIANAPFLATMIGGASYIVVQTGLDLGDAEKDLKEKQELLVEAKRVFDMRNLAQIQAVDNANALQAMKDAL